MSRVSEEDLLFECGGLVLGDIVVVGPVEGHFGTRDQPRRDVVQQADRAVHLVAVEGRVVVVERPEGAAVDVRVGIAIKLVHRAILVFVCCAFKAFPATGPAVEQTFVEVAVRLSNLRRVEAEIIQIGERHIDLDFLRHVKQSTHIDGSLTQVTVVDDGIGARVGERDTNTTKVASILESDIVVHRMASLEDHLQVVGLR